MKALNINNELGEFIVFVSRVAIAIRMNSAYNKRKQINDGGKERFMSKKEVDLNVMWLSDSLHNLDALGRAIQDNNYQKIIWACDMLISQYQNDDYLKVFNKYKQYFTYNQDAHENPLGYASELFSRIKNKASAERGDTCQQ